MNGLVSRERFRSFDRPRSAWKKAVGLGRQMQTDRTANPGWEGKPGTRTVYFPMCLAGRGECGGDPSQIVIHRVTNQPE